MSTSGIGPEIASAHVLVTASFAGMATEVRKQATTAAKQLSTSFTSASSAAGIRFSALKVLASNMTTDWSLPDVANPWPEDPAMAVP